MKIILSLLLIIAAIGFSLNYKSSSDLTKYEKDCPFCSETILTKQCIYENESIYLLLSHKPILEGHCLIIPKRHVQNVIDLTPEELAAIHSAVKKLQNAKPSPFLLLQKNGVEVGQSVPHVHFHYIPRNKGETSSLPVLTKFFFSPLLRPLSEEKMKKQITLIQKLFENYQPLVKNCEEP